MAQRLRSRPQGFRGAMPRCSRSVLQWVGFACVCMGTLSASVIQRGLIRLDGYTSGALYEALAPENGMFGAATAAVLLSLFSMLALPIYAKLLYEGFRHTADAKGYLLRLGGCALVSEIPFDLAMNGKWLDMSGQNPLWAMAAALVMLLILRQYEGKGGPGGAAFKAMIVIAGCAWALLLRSQMGVLLVLLAALFYFFSSHRGFTLAAGILLCLIQFPAPFGMLFVHWYDDRKGDAPRWLFYVLYPVQLLLFAAAGIAAALLHG